MNYFEKLNRLEELSKDINNSKEVLNLIKSDSDLFRDFFQKLDIGVEWFWILKEFYNPEQITCDNNRSEFWIILQYLEKVSILNKDGKIYKELLKIIESIIEYSKETKKINDYYNWWHVAKILVNIPVNRISSYFKESKYSFYETVYEITDYETSVSLAIVEFGEKILPELLKENYIELALEIIEIITLTKKPDDSDVLGSIKAKFETYNIEEIFKNNYEYITASEGERIIELLIKKFHDSLKLNRFESEEHFVFQDNYYEIKIKRIQEEDYSIKDNKYILTIAGYENTEYEQAKKAAEEKNSDIHYQIYLGQYKPQNEIAKAVFCGGYEELKKAFTKAIQNTIISDLILSNVSDELRRAYHNLFADFFNIKISDLDSDDDIIGSRDDVSDMLLGVIKDIFLLYIKKNDEIVQKYIKEFLSEKYIFPIFKKLAFYFIFKGDDKYLDIFENQIESNNDVLADGYYDLEVFNILKERNKIFTQGLIEKIGNSIEAKSKDFDQVHQDMFLFKWYSALKDHEYFKTKYSEGLNKLDRSEPYNPFIGGVTVREYSTDTLVSPINGEQIRKMAESDINKLIIYLKEYTSDNSEFDQEFYGKPGILGLASKLSFVVKENPKKFIDNLDKFKAVDLLYLKNILNGIELSIHDNKDFDFEKIMDFFICYLDEVKCEEREEESYNNSGYRSIVARFIDIFKRGIEQNKIGISPENKKRIDTIIDKNQLCPYDKVDYEITDFISYTLNTILGRTIMLFVDFYLKYAKTNGKEESWGKNKFEKLYDKGIDGKILFGYYLPQINYLDKDYVSEKIKLIPDDDWLYFVSGYFSNSRLYLDIVNLMRGNYIQAISYEKFSSLVDRKLVEHFALIYLYYNDSLENENNSDGTPSLIYRLFNTFNEKFTERMLILSDYIGMRLDKGKKNELIELWKYIFKNQDKFKNNMGEKYSEFPCRLIEISKLVDKIDDEYAEIMKWNIKFVKSYHIQHFFKTLTKFESVDQIHYISDILTDMLEMPVPSYDKGYITILVKRIYAVPELKEKADNICNTYGRRGVHFLRELYEENNKG